MAAPTKLSEPEIQAKLAQLDGWTLADGKLYKQFQFESFVRAFGWMSSAALIAETMGHHPEWSNVYNRVNVYLTTHDASGITDLDFQLAQGMDQLPK